MILDSSAVIAILLNEADQQSYLRAIGTAIAQSIPVRISAATALECSLVLQDRSRKNLATQDATARLSEFLKIDGIELFPFDAEQYELARHAAEMYGKGSGHPAQLNFGDCFSYALAKHLNEPLLFKGNDFSHTDIEPAPI